MAELFVAVRPGSLGRSCRIRFCRKRSFEMQNKGKYSWAKHLDFLVIDLLSLLGSYFLAYYYKFHTTHLSAEWKRYIVIICLLNVVIYLVVNPYSGFFRRRYYHEIGRTFILTCVNALCATLIFYVLKIGASYSREVFVYTYLLYFFLSVILKYIWKRLLISGKLPYTQARKISLFLICEEENAERDIHSVYSTDLLLYDIKGVHLIGRDDSREPPSELLYTDGQSTAHIPVIGENYAQYILDNNINEVLAAVGPEVLRSSVYRELVANGVGVNLVVESLMGFQTEEQSVSNIGVNKALSVGTFSFSPSQGFYLIIKRLFDMLCGLFGIVLLIPVTLLVKLAYLLSGDRAQIFYRQRRVGLNGKLIFIWKFRSMVPNAGEILEELLKDPKYAKEWAENQKLEHDPRVTKVGEFLRKTSVDELPQLINVLRGDMSLVGPRPLVVGELEAHNGLKLYQKVKPGITGWWGCNGRSNIDYRERLELEYYYVRNCSLYLDVLCIIRTLWAVLIKDGAQ